MSSSDPKCIKCKSQFYPNQNAIQCDKCDGWLHLKCSGMSKKDFIRVQEDTEFVCNYCKNYPCGKCEKPVYPSQNAVECSHDQCSKWYHLRCSPFSQAEYLSKKSRLHTEPWFCPDCTMFPFNTLNTEEMSKLVDDGMHLREFFSTLTTNSNFSHICSVCNRRINQNQIPKSLPCTSCSSYVHRKCCNINLSDLLSCKPSHLRHWNCHSCMRSKFPFQNEDKFEISKTSFNSLMVCPCQRISCDCQDNLDQLESFSVYDQTMSFESSVPVGPDPSNFLDTTFDINAKCNYYGNHDFHKLTAGINKKDRKPFSVFHTNIQSLTHNFDNLEILLANLGYLFDVIAVTETWNPDNKSDKFIPKRLNGYEKYTGIGGSSLKSGCGLYIRTGIKFIERKKLDIKYQDDLNEFQCKFIEIINDKGANMILGITYRHPKKASDNTYTEKIQDALDIISKEHKIIMLLGDFNYNLFKYSYDKNVNHFTNTMLSNYLQPIINKPTRVIKKQKPSLIDNFFINAVDKDITCGNLTSKISDHMPNFMFMKNVVFDHKKAQKKIRCTKNANVEEYQADIASIDLTPILLTTSDVHIICKYYHDQVTNVINKHYPYRTLTNEELKWINKPWIDKRLQGLIKEKNNLYHKYLSKNRDQFWYGRYSSLKDDVLKPQLERAKTNHFVRYFEQNINNSKKIWDGINEIIHNKFTKINSEIFLDENGNIITDQKKVAAKFNKFYANIAGKLLCDLGKPNTKYQDYLKNPNEHSMYLNETDPGEVGIIISKLDITKAGDVYGISPKLVKLAGVSFAYNLSIIYNLSMETGIFPQLLKRAKVIPVHKGDSRMETKNYRPISLLPIFNKNFEKILHSRITSFIEKYKILYNRQYGFQKGKSTEYALIDIQESILQALERKEIPCCVFLDFAKAFDTVNHKILLGKLHHYGIRGNALQLIESYLTDREQCVEVNDTTSGYEPVLHGVPQGSILGPLFFIIYINDIALSSNLLSFFLFADDTTILFSHKNIDILEQTINQELIHVSNWLIANKLSLNVKKSNVLVFRTKDSTVKRQINIIINGTQAEEKLHAKYLGVLIDNKLSYVNHVNHVNSKLTKGNAIISKVRNYIPHNILVNTYHAFLQSHINYGLNVWGNAAKTNLVKIERQQRKAIRTMHFKKRDYKETEQLFKQSKILPLSLSQKLVSSKLLWQRKNSLLDQTISSLFDERPNGTFHVPFRRIELTQRSICYRGVQTWNQIPLEIRSVPSLNCFKDKYNKFLLNQL